MLLFDYKPEIKAVLMEIYTPASPDDENVKFITLEEIRDNLTRVLPFKKVSESDTYEVLKELGYKISPDDEDKFGFMVKDLI